MNNIPRQTLKQLTAAYGVSLCDNPARCKGLLKDTCGAYPLEINLLITALEEQIDDELLTTSNGIPYEVLSKRLTNHLKESRGLDEEYAQWAVDSWAEALGVHQPPQHLDPSASSGNTTSVGASNGQNTSPSFYQQGDLLKYPKKSPTPHATFSPQLANSPAVQASAAPLHRSTDTNSSFSSSPAKAATSNKGRSSSAKDNAILIISLLVILGIIGAVLAVNSANQNGSGTSLYPPAGATLALNDPLTSNANGWSTGPDGNGGDCEFTGGSLQASQANAGTLTTCMLNSTNFSDFAFQVQMTVTQGDAGGLIFRSQGGGFYALFISEIGEFTLDAYGTSEQTLANQNIPAFNQGLNQTNTIAVMAQGSTITIFVNQQQVDQIQDSTYSSGSIGLLASAYGDNNAPEVVSYSNLKVWTF
jgi:hypothetical protein